MARYIKRRRSASRVVSLLYLFIIALSLSLAGCSKGAGGNSLHLKSAATGEKDFAIKSSYAFAVTKTFTDTAGKITTAPSYRTYVASYDLDAGNFAMTLDKPLTSEDQLRVVFSLVGEQGGNEKTPPKAGTYAAKADKFMKVEDVAIVSRKGAADNKVWLDRSTLSGEVKITSASASSISGDVDLIAGESTIKGSFTAKVLTRK
ncbi:MAG TPA: hypothetical protein VLN44_04920 [Pyrinomonadaceae bacterium]|nr:hypothetical protein [Pyrinomonadaceae bacterium]